MRECGGAELYVDAHVLLGQSRASQGRRNSRNRNILFRTIDHSFLIGRNYFLEKTRKTVSRSKKTHFQQKKRTGARTFTNWSVLSQRKHPNGRKTWGGVVTIGDEAWSNIKTCRIKLGRKAPLPDGLDGEDFPAGSCVAGRSHSAFRQAQLCGVRAAYCTCCAIRIRGNTSNTSNTSYRVPGTIYDSTTHGTRYWSKFLQSNRTAGATRGQQN